MVAKRDMFKKSKPKVPKKISFDTFQKRYLTKEDQFKYEWVNGVVEKTLKTMNQNQLYILINLQKFLAQLKIKSSINGYLASEIDSFFSENHRRPDIAFYTEEQIKESSKSKNVIPQFVIEVISTNDQINRVHKKMEDYRKAGVKVVWHIFPELNQVHVYDGQGKKMEICKGKDKCSAESVIKKFKISVNDIFRTD